MLKEAKKLKDMSSHFVRITDIEYVKTAGLDGRGIKDYYDSERFKAEFSGKERPDDIIKQCYAEL